MFTVTASSQVILAGLSKSSADGLRDEQGGTCVSHTRTDIFALHENSYVKKFTNHRPARCHVCAVGCCIMYPLGLSDRFNKQLISQTVTKCRFFAGAEPSSAWNKPYNKKKTSKLVRTHAQKPNDIPYPY